MSSLPPAYASLDLKGKVALITGGSSGIGAGTARLFASRGAKVVIASRREAESKAIVDEIEKDGGDAFFIRMDVCRENDVIAAVQATVERYGRLDIAFNNSGIMGPNGPTHLHDTEAVRQVLEVDTLGVYMCMKHEIAQMLRQIENDAQPDVASLDHEQQPNDYFRLLSRHSIINNASIFATTALPTYSTYSAAKHAVIGLTKSAAIEYATKGIRINAVNFGFIASEITGKEAVGFMIPMVPVSRLGQSVEAAEAVAWLASGASTFMTGASLTVDGGVTAKSM